MLCATFCGIIFFASGLGLCIKSWNLVIVVVLVGWVGFGRWKRIGICTCTAGGDWGAPTIVNAV